MRCKKGQKLERKFNAAAQGTGSAAGIEAGNSRAIGHRLISCVSPAPGAAFIEDNKQWPLVRGIPQLCLFDIFYGCCVAGNPADQGEKDAPDSVHRSALPQPEADDVSCR